MQQNNETQESRAQAPHDLQTANDNEDVEPERGSKERKNKIV